VLKAGTAGVSIATAIALIPILPKALALPGLPKLIGELEGENEQRARAQEAAQRAASKLERSNTELQEMVSTVSHDLRSPLVTISGFVDRVHSRLSDESRQNSERDFARINAAIEQMSSHIEQLVGVSRIAFREPVTTHFNLAQLIRDVVDSLDPTMTNGLSLSTDEADIEIKSDEGLIGQIIQNLVENACTHAADEAGRVSVSIRATLTEHVLTIETEDDGPGIPLDHRDRVRRPFERYNTTKPGTGMGLAIIARAARRLNGDLEILEGAQGGALFRIKIEVADQV
jgi:signal transduction histidine kinase